MTFDLCDPRPPTVYSNPLREFYDRFSNVSDSTLRCPVDRYDNTGGSFPVRPTCSPCGHNSSASIPNERPYIARYLKNNRLYTNPTTLCALKNTRVLKDLLQHPPIIFTSPKYSRGPCRSTTHFELNPRYEATLCAITDNLRDEHRVLRALDLKKRAKSYKKFVHGRRSEHHHPDTADSVRSVLGGRLPSIHRRHSEGVPRTPRRRTSGALKSAKLIDICKQGDLLSHVRKNVAQRILNLDLDDEGAIKNIFPPSDDILFEVEEFPQYAYPSHGAMASLCSTKRSANTFYENKSDKELHHPKKSSDERIHKLSMPLQMTHGLPKGLAYSPSLLDSIAKAHHLPSHLRTLRHASHHKHKFSHLGLIAEAKRDIVRDARDQLDRREAVRVPRELTVSTYGPLKDVPENPLGPLLPIHLAVKDFPPTPQELDRVARHSTVHRQATKTKDRREHPFYTSYTKPLLTDSEEEGVCGHELDEVKGHPERIPPSLLISGSTRLNLPAHSRRCSPHSLINHSPHTLPKNTSHHSSIHKIKQKTLTILSSPAQVKPASSLSNFHQRGESESSLQRFDLRGESQSSPQKFDFRGESQPSLQKFDPHRGSELSLQRFAQRRESEVDRMMAFGRRRDEVEDDVAFSDVAVPDISDIQELTFYRNLRGKAEDESDSSGDEDETEEEEEISEKPSPPPPEDAEDADDEEEEEEAPPPPPPTEEQGEVTVRMRELVGDNFDVERVFHTDAEWRRLVKVERVPKQVHLKDPPPTTSRKGELPPRLQAALFDYKGIREAARVRRVAEAAAERRKDVAQFKSSLFGLYSQTKKRSKEESLMFHNPRFMSAAKSAYELTFPSPNHK